MSRSLFVRVGCAQSAEVELDPSSVNGDDDAGRIGAGRGQVVVEGGQQHVAAPFEPGDDPLADAELAGEMAIEELIVIAERSACCEVYGLLKRPDEKYVTERAYDNPKFVEDLVRDVALALNQDPRVGAYVVEAENFESIHNHSAFARIERTSRAMGQR